MRNKVVLNILILFGFLAIGGFSATLASPAAQATPVPKITFIIPVASYDPIRYESGMLLSREWQKLGLDVEVVPMDFQALSARLQTEPFEDFNAFVSGYVSRPERLDPDVLLYRPFTCAGVATGVNYQGYCSEEYDKVMTEQRSTMDQAARLKLIYQAQQILAHDLPAIALYHVKEIVAYNSDLFENPTPMMGQGLFNIWDLTSITPKTDQKILAMGKVDDLDTLNPFAPVTSGANTDMLRLIYDLLARIKPDGSVEPWAAESWEIIDDTTVKVNLRQGMKWSDGEPVTADDVKFSYELQKTSGASIYAPFLEPIDSVEVVDPNTVIFHLGHPYPALFQVTFPQILLVPKHVWEKETGVLADVQVETPIGSGPFKWGEWKHGESILILANKEHFHAPKIDGFISIVYANPDAIFQGLVSGDAQIPDRRLLPSQINELEQHSNLTRVEEDDFGVYYVGFNLRVPPFDKLEFRQAIAHTIDYDTIVNTILEGYGVRGGGFIAPANKVWHDPDVSFPDFDPAAARQILTDAGYTWDADGKLLMPAS